MRLKTPAKITLVLRVLGLRRDGYHNVQIALVPVSIFDELDVLLLSDKGLSLEVDSPEDLGAVEENLVFRAARAFAAATGSQLRHKLRLRKCIPTGAGLGGGSGNAAAVLIAFNRLAGSPLTPDQLVAEAAKLGADVPFFIAAIPAWAGGRGERLTPIGNVPRLPLLVVKPGFSINTGQAYRLLAEFRRGNSDTLSGEAPAFDSIDGVVAALHNAFEPVLFRTYPELEAIKARLIAEGAIGALLSGSGSALFGIFDSERARDLAAERIGREERWAVLACETLAGHAYEPET